MNGFLNWDVSFIDLPATEKPANAAAGMRTAAPRNTPHKRRIPGLQPQPEVQPDATVYPNKQYERCLDIGLARPHGPQSVVVVVVNAIKFMGNPGADDMAEQQERNGKAEQKLDSFPSTHFKVAALGYFIKGKANMDDKCEAQNSGAGQ